MAACTCAADSTDPPHASGATDGIRGGRSADRHRLAPSRRVASSHRTYRPLSPAARNDPGARTRPRTPSRFHRESLSDGGRDIVLLPPRGLVDLFEDPRGARTLL